MDRRQQLQQTTAHFFRFLLQVMKGFIRNQGLLISGAVAYYTLMSIVPLSIIALIVMTNFVEEVQLIHTLSTYFEMVIPGYAATLTEQVRVFLAHRNVVGVIGFLGLLFFSSTAFSMLESAMALIFIKEVRVRHRNILTSAIIPYGYIFMMGLGIMLVSLVVGVIETLENNYVSVFGWDLDLGGATGAALYYFGLVGEVLMFTSIYLVMPLVRVRFRHALIGGVTAALLWEITRRLLVWYYAAFPMVNVIYGSISITVIALLSVQVVAVILLLGAQVIAELEAKLQKQAACINQD